MVFPARFHNPLAPIQIDLVSRRLSDFLRRDDQGASADDPHRFTVTAIGQDIDDRLIVWLQR